MEKTKSLLFQIVIQEIKKYGLSEKATEIMTAGFAESTRGQYDAHLNSFQEFCKNRGLTDFTVITVETGIDFLTKLFDRGLSYSSINSARSAISQFTVVLDSTFSFGCHPITHRFMKGVFRLRPPCPKYMATWNVSPLLKYLEDLDDSKLKSLSIKCVSLIALTTGQRMQTIAAIDIRFLTSTDDKLVFSIKDALKTSKPGKHKHIEIFKYTSPGLCPVSCVKKYLNMTQNLRGGDRLFLSLLKPHKAVGAQTLSRWVKLGLLGANIDKSFGAHSIRHASSSKAAFMNVPTEKILSTVGWSNESVFARFYRRPILETQESLYADAVLN